MVGDLFHRTCQNKVRLGIYSIGNAKIKYGWQWSSLNRPKQGTAEDLFHRTSQNKVWLGIYFIENAEIRYGWGI